eukprot:COSAG03_NODE_445_length_7847_cov_65.378807_11_plen_170_part_00
MAEQQEAAAATRGTEENPASAAEILRRHQEESISPGRGRKKQRLPAEYRSLLAGEAGLNSDSDDEIDHIVATLRHQRKRAGRWKLCACVSVALMLGIAVGGIVATTLVAEHDDDDGARACARACVRARFCVRVCARARFCVRVCACARVCVSRTSPIYRPFHTILIRPR